MPARPAAKTAKKTAKTKPAKAAAKKPVPKPKPRPVAKPKSMAKRVARAKPQPKPAARPKVKAKAKAVVAKRVVVRAVPKRKVTAKPAPPKRAPAKRAAKPAPAPPPPPPKPLGKPLARAVPPKVRPKAKRRPVKLTPEMAKYRDMLLAERARLELELEEIEARTARATEAERATELSSYEDHPADLASETFEREKDLAIAESVESLLDQVNTALEKVDLGTYGVCDACGRPIKKARLQALPFATLCLDCQGRLEG